METGGQKEDTEGSPEDDFDLRSATAGLSKEQYAVLFEELLELNDRNLVVLAVSLLAFRVNDCLKYHFEVAYDDGVVARLIGGGEQGGYLGFTKQCELAYALGVFGRKTLSDLSAMAKIRNRFAHKFGPLSFTEPKISGLCLNLAKHNEGIKLLFPPRMPGLSEEAAHAEFTRLYDTDPKTRFIQVFYRYETLLRLSAWSEQEHRAKMPQIKNQASSFMQPKKI